MPHSQSNALQRHAAHESRRGKPALAGIIVLATAALGLFAPAAAHGATTNTPYTFTTQQPDYTSSLTEGTFNEFTGSNGRMLQYHYFENGDNGTLFYFDGDQTTNYHYPNVDASVVHQPGVGNGHVQRMNAEAAARGMDLVFLEHPHGEDVPLGGPVRVTGTSWWDYMDDSVGGEVDEYAATVREIVAASGAENVQLVGYSGGSEFLARHLLRDGNAWLPTNSAAAMIGGGGLAGYPLQPPAAGKEDMSYAWLVGTLDGPNVEDTSIWSALRVSRNTVTDFQNKGYTGATIKEFEGNNHTDYNFRAMVAERLDLLLENSGDRETTVTISDLGDGAFSIEASGDTPGDPITVKLVQANTVIEANPTDGGVVDSRGRYSGTFTITDTSSVAITPGRYLVSATVDGQTSDSIEFEVRPPQNDPSGLYQQYVGNNSRMLQFHYFDNSTNGCSNGTVYYFDGDQTTNFHNPMIPASVTHTNGFNGHVQRINEEAKARGMDLVFLEHPHGEDVNVGGPVRVTGTSWWDYMDDSTGGEVDQYAQVVREIVASMGGDSVQLVGYSGGSEFLVRHLLLNGNGWLPENSAAAMIGGGGLAGFDLQQPTTGKEDMSYAWLVGTLDGPNVEDTSVWSALRVSRSAAASFQAKGYTGALVKEFEGKTHTSYDYRGMVSERLDLLLANANTLCGDDTGAGSDTESGSETGASDTGETETGPVQNIGTSNSVRAASALAHTGNTAAQYSLFAIGAALLIASGTLLTGSRIRRR